MTASSHRLARRRAGLAGPAAAALLALCLAGPAPAQAQEAQDETARLVEQLRGLIERGRAERLADPFFLRELETLVSRYDWPWQTTVLSSDFSGRDPAPPAPWQVSEPEWLVDWRFGLRSVVTPPRPAQAQPQPQAGQQNRTAEEAAVEIIGGLLQGVLQGQRGQQGQQQQAAQPAQPADDPGYAAVRAPVGFANAFAVTADLTQRTLPDVAAPRFELGVYQGQDIQAGYRLVLMPQSGAGQADGGQADGGQAGGPTLALLKLTPRGTSSTLEQTSQPLDLVDGHAHRLVWTRGRDGQMSVSLDGQELFAVLDRGYNDPFDGLVALNGGGDFAMQQVLVQAAQ
jgi:hypothetical protein